LATKDAELMAEYRDLDVLLVRGRSESNQIEQLTNDRKVIGQPIPMIVADARQCWSAAESRACTLQAWCKKLPGPSIFSIATFRQ
jgi:hypothetical protein